MNKKINVSSVYGKAVDPLMCYDCGNYPQCKKKCEYIKNKGHKTVESKKRLEMLENYLSLYKKWSVYTHHILDDGDCEFSIVIFEKKINYMDFRENDKSTITFEFWGYCNDLFHEKQKMTYLFDKWVDELDCVEFELAIREAIDDYMETDDYVEIENNGGIV